MSSSNFLTQVFERETDRELLRQTMFLASVLSGFSFSVVVQLIALKSTARLNVIASILFIFNALVLLFSIWTGFLAMVQTYDYENRASISNTFWNANIVSLWVGIIGFAVGTAVLGFLHSKVVGAAALLLGCVFITGIVLAFVVHWFGG
jgi:hypothetical protein